MQLKFLSSHGTIGHIKTVVLMKFFLLNGILLLVSGSVCAQNITITLINAPLEKVFKEIKKQSGYNFVYTRDQIKKAVPVSIKVRDEPLKTVLDICFRDQPLAYITDGKHVIVKDKTERQSAPMLNSSPLIKAINISGKVVNENGNPLEGASVIAKMAKKGVSTDFKGEFILQGIPESDYLLITNVGFKSKEILVKEQGYVLIKLELTVTSLEETIIKGYYSTTKKLNTGSVSKVSGSQITDQSVSNPVLGLEGLVPGLLITQHNGLPGSRFSALIRGQNSIQNGNSPLFIIDGVPFLSDNDALTQLNGLLANSPFNSIDPNDIESIEVLKDADATAIYGSRGANGVLIITTKRAEAEKSDLSLNISRGWGKVARTVKLMNTWQYLEMRNEAFFNDGIIPEDYNAPDLVLWDSARYTDWQKVFIGGTAQIYNVQLRYSGGNEFTKFSVGTGYYKETTVFPDEFGIKKTTADININHKSQDNKLNLILITSYGNDKSRLPAQDLTPYIYFPPNSYHLKDALGNYVWREADYSVGNPLALLEQKNNALTGRLTANGIISYKPIRSLEIKANVGYNSVDVTEKNFSPLLSQDPEYAMGSLVLGDNFLKTWIIEPQASYKFDLKTNLQLATLVGLTWQKTESERKLIIGDGYTNDDLLGSIQAAPYISATNSTAQYNYAALFGRIGIEWDNKYVINITGRRDASSRFGPDNRLANFGAAGVAWVFTNETFIKRNLPFLSFGKLRGSYGITGNDQIGNYQYLDTYKGTIYAYQYQPGLMPVRLFNSDYNWEKNKKMEFAIELGFLQNRLTANFNYYKNRSDNQIIRYSLPSQTGFADILMNFPGVVQNAGCEILVNAEIMKTNNLRWNTSFNISHNKNKLVSFPGLKNSSYSSTYMIGKPLNAYRGLYFAGVDAQTGVYEFEDLNKDGVIDNDDYGYIGTTDPKYFGGFSNTFKYKGFGVNVLFEFRKQLGRDVVYSYLGLLGTIQNQPVYVLNRWRKPGDISGYQKYSQDYTNAASSATYNVSRSDAILTDASYLRFKNIVLFYDLPDPWLKKLKVVSCKVFSQMQNVLTISNYVGNDPESQSISSLPPLKIITAGIQANF